MSILAATARLVESARAIFPASERDQAGEAYFELAQDFIRISKNKLDIRHILALYRWFGQHFLDFDLTNRTCRPCTVCRRLHWFGESVGALDLQRADTDCFTGSVSSFVAEAVGLAFTTGLHRSTKEFNMDPVTLQVSSLCTCKM